MRTVYHVYLPFSRASCKALNIHIMNGRTGIANKVMILIQYSIVETATTSLK